MNVNKAMYKALHRMIRVESFALASDEVPGWHPDTVAIAAMASAMRLRDADGVVVVTAGFALRHTRKIVGLMTEYPAMRPWEDRLSELEDRRREDEILTARRVPQLVAA